jgi:hypothetical protein
MSKHWATVAKSFPCLHSILEGQYRGGIRRQTRLDARQSGKLLRLNNVRLWPFGWEITAPVALP